MPKQVQLPDGNIGQFPDSMSNEDIAAVLRKQYPPRQEPGFLDRLADTTYRPVVGALHQGYDALSQDFQEGLAKLRAGDFKDDKPSRFAAFLGQIPDSIANKFIQNQKETNPQGAVLPTVGNVTQALVSPVTDPIKADLQAGRYRAALGGMTGNAIMAGLGGGGKTSVGDEAARNIGAAAPEVMADVARKTPIALRGAASGAFDSAINHSTGTGGAAVVGGVLGAALGGGDLPSALAGSKAALAARTAYGAYKGAKQALADASPGAKAAADAAAREAQAAAVLKARKAALSEGRLTLAEQRLAAAQAAMERAREAPPGARPPRRTPQPEPAPPPQDLAPPPDIVPDPGTAAPVQQLSQLDYPHTIVERAPGTWKKNMEPLRLISNDGANQMARQLGVAEGEAHKILESQGFTVAGQNELKDAIIFVGRKLGRTPGDLSDAVRNTYHVDGLSKLSSEGRLHFLEQLQKELDAGNVAPLPLKREMGEAAARKIAEGIYRVGQ